jgi:hypothetical protein
MQKVHLFNRSSLTIGTCAALMFALSGCESTGGMRLGSVGTPSGGSTADAGGSGSGSGSTADAGGSAGGGGSVGAGAGGASGGTQANGGAGSSAGTGGATQAAAGPVLAAAGNAGLAVSNGQGGALTPIATALPVTRPVTGTITKVLNDTGTVLVDAGQGRTLLVEGARGVAGDVLTINVNDRAVTSPLGGGQGAIGVGALGSSPQTGTIASAGVLNAGNSVLADVNGVGGVRVSNVTATTGGVSGDLVNAALGGNQLVGSTNPALITANLAPNGVPAIGQPGSVTGVLSPVTQAVGNVAGNTSAGTVVNGAVNGTVGTTPVLGNGAGVSAIANGSAGSGAANGGLLGPVTTTVNGAVNGTNVLAPVNATVNGTVNAATNTVLPRP